MKILVLNCGSSSVKFQLIEIIKEKVIAKGVVEKIGLPSSSIKYVNNKTKIKKTVKVSNHTDAINIVVAYLTDEKTGCIKEKKEIEAVGHRVVHGGEFYKNSVLITDEVIKNLKSLIELAPLHNPSNIAGINACREVFQNTPQIAVFDTAFHQTMPDYSYIYALPYALYKRYKIRRYGFHGTSHFYVSRETASFLNKNIDDLKIVTAHIGNGASMAAVKGGKCIDTSMGFTPLEGLVMGTRCGDIDPAIILYLMAKEELSIHETDTLMNKHSGLLGISGVSNDLRDIQDGMEDDERKKLAFNVYCYRIKKYIGSYIAALNGADAVVFTGGAGENSSQLRLNVCEGLEGLGIEIDPVKNEKIKGEKGVISKDSSKLKIIVMPTNEEFVIAKDCYKILK